MRSRAALAVLLTAALGVIALLVGRAFDERPLQQNLGVFIAHTVVPLSPGQTGCEGSIALSGDTSAVTFNPGTPHEEPGPAIAVTVVDSYSKKVLARGRVERSFDPAKAQTVALSPTVKENSEVDVCFLNRGPGQTLLFGDTAEGDAHPTLSTAVATIDGKPLINEDIAMVFPRRSPKSVLALVPQIFSRASLFRPSVIGPWVYWLLAALLILGTPVLLARAVTRAADEEDGDEPLAGTPAPEDEVVDAPLKARG